MATNKELEVQVNDINSRLSRLANANSKLSDDLHVLKGNYNKLVKDVNLRLEEVHKKIFR